MGLKFYCGILIGCLYCI